MVWRKRRLPASLPQNQLQLNCSLDTPKITSNSLVSPWKSSLRVAQGIDFKGKVRRTQTYEPRGRGFESCQPHQLFEGVTDFGL